VQRYTIIAGHRRHAAAKLANLDSCPASSGKTWTPSQKQLVAMLVENTQRADLTPCRGSPGYQARA
jgi:ParB family chromosome partitioning protein